MTEVKGQLDQAITLDMSLDDIDDLPAFVVPPTGAYSLKIVEVGQKEINDHPAMEFKFEILSIEEMTEELDDGEVPPKTGDQFSLPYMMDNAFGAGAMKELLRPFAVKLGTSKLSELIPQLKGMMIIMVLKRTYDKKKDRHYPKMKKIAIL
jgi:hypothetical protein